VDVGGLLEPFKNIYLVYLASPELPFWNSSEHCAGRS